MHDLELKEKKEMWKSVRFKGKGGNYVSISLETSCALDKFQCCFYNSSIRYNSKLGIKHQSIH